MSTSGGRHFGVNVGEFPSRYEAERALLKTALAESATLNDGLRKTAQSGGSWRASQTSHTTPSRADAARPARKWRRLRRAREAALQTATVLLSQGSDEQALDARALAALGERVGAVRQARAAAPVGELVGVAERAARLRALHLSVLAGRSRALLERGVMIPPDREVGMLAGSRAEAATVGDHFKITRGSTHLNSRSVIRLMNIVSTARYTVTAWMTG